MQRITTRCLQCGRNAERRESDDEIRILCPACGYRFLNQTLYSNRSKDGINDPLPPVQKWMSLWRTVETQGIGVAFLSGSHGSRYVLLPPMIEEVDIKGLYTWINNGYFDPSRSYIAIWDSEKNELKMLFGSVDALPPRSKVSNGYSPQDNRDDKEKMK